MRLENIEKSLQGALVGKNLQYIKRTCELVELGFGRIFRRKNRHGKDVEVAEYTLHLLCPFRITAMGKILIGSDDLFVSSSKETDLVDLDKHGTCVFDERLELFHHFCMNEIVSSVVLTENGDLNLQLTTLQLSVFCVSSTESEMWRFFETGTDKPHVIRVGNKYDIF